MDPIRVSRRPEREDDRGEDDSPAEGAEPRSRLRRALICPFCRDSVGRDDALVCARRGCGAFYHRECWRECAEQYGGCAIYGCESKHATELSRARFLLRVLRLLFAGTLFPRRVAQALRTYEERSSLPVRGFVPLKGWALIVEQCRQSLVTLTGARDLVHALGCFTLAAVGAAAFFAVVRTPPLALWANPAAVREDTLRFCAVVVLGIMASVAALLLGFHLLRAFALVLASELSALLRADVGADTVIARLRRGDGAK